MPNTRRSMSTTQSATGSRPADGRLAMLSWPSIWTMVFSRWSPWWPVATVRMMGEGGGERPRRLPAHPVAAHRPQKLGDVLDRSGLGAGDLERVGGGVGL